MKVFVASDFHLKFSENREDRSRKNRVISFLDSLIGKADLLILNGDIFDLWYSWNHVIIKNYFPVLKKLADLKESGCKIVFVAGNHDFWFKDFLSDTLGMEIHREYYTTKINGKNYFIAHGDKYTTNDLRYHLFRSLIRNKFIMKIFEFMHPDIALNIGKYLSRSSRVKKISHRLVKMRESGLEIFAQKQLKHYDVVIMGHSHNPKIKKFTNGLYLNAGDWIVNNSYIEIDAGKPKLHYYKSEKKNKNH